MYDPQHAGTKHSPERVETRGFEQLPELLTATEAAAFLRVSMPTFYRLVRKGEIKTVRLGTGIRVPKNYLRTLMFEDGRHAARVAYAEIEGRDCVQETDQARQQTLSAVHPDVLRHTGALHNLGSQLLAAQPDLRSITISVELDLAGGAL